MNELVQPAESTSSKVEEWLCSSGVKKENLQYSAARDWIKAALPIQHAEKFLDTNYSIFEHHDESVLVRTPQWSLPLDLHEHIETIQPTNSFTRSKPKRSALQYVPVAQDQMEIMQQLAIAGKDKATAAEASDVNSVATNCLRTLYGMQHPSSLPHFLTSSLPPFTTMLRIVLGTANYTVQSPSKNSIGVPNFGG